MAMFLTFPIPPTLLNPVFFQHIKHIFLTGWDGECHVLCVEFCYSYAKFEKKLRKP